MPSRSAGQFGGVALPRPRQVHVSCGQSGDTALQQGPPPHPHLVVLSASSFSDPSYNLSRQESQKSAYQPETLGWLPPRLQHPHRQMETSLSSQSAKAQGRNCGRVSGGKPRSLNLYFFTYFFFTINLHKQENQKPKKKKKKWTKEEKKKTKQEVLWAWSLKSIHPNSKALICQRTVHWYYLEEEEQWSGDSNNGEINSKKVCTKQITW